MTTLQSAHHDAQDRSRWNCREEEPNALFTSTVDFLPAPPYYRFGELDHFQVDRTHLASTSPLGRPQILRRPPSIDRRLPTTLSPPLPRPVTFAQNIVS